jgi:hypothetical protein
VERITPELLELLLAVLRADEGCKKKFLGREEELLAAAASMMLALKGGGEIGRTKSAADTSPFVRDMEAIETSVERCQLPQTYTSDERKLLDKGHAFAAEFNRHEDALTKLNLGHKLATADCCDTGQRVMMRGKWELSATPLEAVAYYMGHTDRYATRKENGLTSRAIKMGERR